MIKKILFQTLQRLDLEDANELQQGVLDKVENVITSLRPFRSNSQRVGAPAKTVTVQGVTNGIVTFDTFSVISAEDNIFSFDSTDVSNGLTQCDITETISEYNTNIANGENITGIYFYAYPNIEDGETENREFFSVIDDAPITQSVSTRKLNKLTYFANFDPSYLVEDSNGNRPIKLGYVVSGNIIGSNVGSPFLTSSFISYNYFDAAYGDGQNFDDNSLPNVVNNRHTSESTDFNPADLINGIGLNSPFRRMERQLQRIMSFGTSDDTTTDLINVLGKPLYSLQGLKKEIEKIEETANETLSVHLDTAVLEPIYSDDWTNNVVGTTNQTTARSTVILNQVTPFRIVAYETASANAASRDIVNLGPTGNGSDFLISDADKYQILLPLASTMTSAQIKSVVLEGAGTKNNSQRGAFPNGIFGGLCSTVPSPGGSYYPYNSATATPGIVFQTSLTTIGIFQNQVVEYFKDNDGEYAAPNFRLLVKIYGNKEA